MAWTLVVLGIVLFVCLVVVHEFGHFIAARRNGVDAEEFGLGFPPRAWSRKTKSGFIFSLNWLPVGGFVRLKGEHDADKGKGSFGAASLGAKAKIMLAGVFMNLLAAFVLLTILAAVGMPQLISNQFTIKSDTKTLKHEVLIAEVESNSPASRAGLAAQDQLVSLSYKNKTYPISNANTLPNLTKSLAGQTVAITYKVQGNLLTRDATLRTTKFVNNSLKHGQQVGYLGISPTDYILSRSTWSSPVVAAGLMTQITALTFKGIGTAIAGLASGNTAKATSQVTGPVGIVILIKDGSLLGYQFVLLIVAIISLSLAIINVLPIPALDGGRVFFTFIPRLILRKPLKQRTEEIINGIGLALLLVLIILISISDVNHYVH